VTVQLHRHRQGPALADGRSALRPAGARLLHARPAAVAGEAASSIPGTSGPASRLPAVWLRLAWRATHRPPALPTSMPKLMQLAAHAGHLALYGLMIAIPLSGWLMSSAKGFQTVWFGVLPIPDLLDKNKELGDLLQTGHNEPEPAVRRRHRRPHRRRPETPLHRQGRHPDPHVAPTFHGEMNMKRIALALAIGRRLAVRAHAVEYNQVQPDKSAINFVYKQMGVAVDGKFKRFPASSVSTRPSRPPPRPVSMSNWPASTPAPRKATKKLPASPGSTPRPSRPPVCFQQRQGARRQPLRSRRQLSIKGKTQDVVVPATFTAQGNSGVFDGSFTIRRADFSIGEGSWAKFDIVANDVLIKFRITAASK
jgi:polyisoprenoid-binding protein YceI